jgi:hypothetical protein
VRRPQGRAKRRLSNLGVIVVTFFAVTAQHFIGFSNQTLSLGNALPQAILARLNLCCVLLSPLSALFGIRHKASTIRERDRARPL